MARLATLVPRPRVNLIRYHGVLAPRDRTDPSKHSPAKEAQRLSHFAGAGPGTHPDVS